MSPGRRTNRKNLGTCQRTSVFLLLLFLQSNKNMRLYPLQNQSSAARSQAAAGFWCSRLTWISISHTFYAGFPTFSAFKTALLLYETQSSHVEMLSQSSNDAELQNSLRIPQQPRQYVCVKRYNSHFPHTGKHRSRAKTLYLQNALGMELEKFEAKY